MNQETIKATIKFIKNSIIGNKEKNLRMDWFGGEPLLVTDLIEKIALEILEFCKKNSIEVNSNIVTNASKIDERSIDFFRRINISKVNITLDGMRDEYEKRKSFVDGKPYFDHIISSIQMLINHGIKVTVRINVDINNVESSLELIDYLGRVLSDEVEVYAAPLYGHTESYLTTENIFPTLKLLQSQIDKYNFKRIHRKSLDKNYCRNSQQNNYMIKPNGDIIHCEHMYNESFAVIGNVFDGIIKDSGWICDKCLNYELCKQGCKDIKNINCDACWKSIWKSSKNT